MKELGSQYISFYKEKWKLLVFCVVITGICFGSRIFSAAVSVDTDTMLCNPGSTLNWLQNGRWGLVLTKYLFHTTWFNTYIAGMMCFCVIILFLMTFSFLFQYVSAPEIKLNLWIFAGLFISHPTFACQWFFKLQELEVAFSIFLVSVALTFIFYWIKTGSKTGLLLGVICMIWSFGSYEANVVLYIAGAMLCFLLSKKEEQKVEITLCVKLIGSFLAAFLIRTVISEVFFTDAVQMENSFLWGKIPLKECLFNIAKNAGIVLLGYKIFNYLYAVLLLLTLVIWIISLKKRKEKDAFRYLVFAVFLVMPFSLAIMTGNMPVYRSLYILPFVMGGGLMYLSGYCEKYQIYSKVFKTLIVVISMIFIVEQCQTTLRLWYTDDVRYEQDCKMLDAVMDDVRDAGISYEGKPIVFYGKWEAPLNPSCYEKVEIFAYSYFDMYSDYYPYYLFSSINLSHFGQINGYDFLSPTNQQAVDAATIAQDMPVWPNEGFVKEENGLIVVKIAENKYQ